jgi:tRNA pseudouridine55 synthase
MDGRKAYLAELKLGQATDTLDKDGTIVEIDEKISDRYLSKCDMSELNLNEHDLNINKFFEASKQFIGKIKQKIPKYSAAKIDGKKGYEYARAGIEIDMPEKEIEIFDIDIKKLSQDVLTFEVSCGSGTFIRQLGSDLARSQNTCGHLISLKRTMSCGFSVSEAFDLIKLII